MLKPAEGTPRMRVKHGDTVFILPHRINAVAERTYPRDTRQNVLARMIMQDHEQKGETYMVQTTWMTRATGAIYIHGRNGDTVSGHHSDVMRA